MRRISAVPDLELDNHKSWYQPLKDELSTPYILVSDQGNQCVVKVFQARFPRIHAKCAMGPDSFDHPKIGILIGVYSYPKEED